MKTSLSVVLLLFAVLLPGTAAAREVAGGGALSGVVLEVKDVPDFTYLRLKTDQGEMWAAVTSAAVRTGASVSLQHPVVMENFVSKTLHKTFPVIVFGALEDDRAVSGATVKPAAHANGGHAAAQTAGLARGERIAKASGAQAYTVAEINAGAVTLKNKTVLVRGKVVKYNGGIMDRNWIHLRDGSGGDDDILVTSTAAARAGDVITVRGVVHTDKDFGAGYAYKVLIEDATLQ